MLLISILCQLIVIAIFPTRWNLSLLSRIGMITLIYSVLLSYNTYYYNNIGSGIGIYGGFYQITSVTQILDIFIYLLGIVILGITGFYSFTDITNNNNIAIIKENNSNEIINKIDFKQVLEYPILGCFIIMGSQFLMGSLNMISIYLSIELQSFSLYILSSINSSLDSSRSGLKYFLLGALSSCFILLGLGLMYCYSGLTSLESLTIFYKVNSPNLYMQVSLLIFIVGFLFKIAIVPFHQWAVDVYDGVPTIITTWLTTLTKISILILLMDIIYYCYEDSWTSLLILASLLSIVLGSVLGLAQIRIKRLLVYSMVSHVGFLLLSLAICTAKSLEAFLFYLIQYSITNLNIFLILITMGYYCKDSYESPIIYIKTLKGFFKTNNILSICFAISLFSLGGIPPLIGFFAKFNVLYAAISEGYLFISIIAILASVISMSYYLGIIKSIFFDESISLKEEIRISTYLSLIISILTLLLLLFILYPNIIYDGIHLLLLSYFN